MKVKYFKELTSYGVIPFLLALEWFEKRGEYEICGDMIESIKYLNSILKKDRFPTKLTPMLSIDVKWTIKKMGLDSDSIMDKSHSYKWAVIESINKV